MQHFRIHGFRLADKAQIHRHPLAGLGIGLGHGHLARHHQIAVLARQAHGPAAGGIDAGDDLLVDGAGQHHLDDFHRRLVGDAQAVDEGGVDVQLLEHRPDLGAAAMHHHRVDAGLLHQHDVLGEVVRAGVGHGVAAILHHDGLLVVFQDVGQRLDQHPPRLAPTGQGAQVAIFRLFSGSGHGAPKGTELEKPGLITRSGAGPNPLLWQSIPPSSGEMRAQGRNAVALERRG